MTKKLLDDIQIDGDVTADVFIGSSESLTLPGFAATTGGSVTSSDTVLTAIEKLEYKVNNSSGSSLPVQVANTFLFTDGTTEHWRPIYASDITPNPAITNFYPATSNLEVGQSIVNPAFIAAYNQTPPSVSLIDSKFSVSITLSNITSFISPHTFSLIAQGNVVFTLTANFTTPSILTTHINWLPRLYYGHSSTFSTVSGLQYNILASSYSGNYTINAGLGEYLYFAIPTSFGTPTFYVGGFAGGISLETTNSFTNTYGITTSYSIYKSDNPSLGNITVQLQ